MSVGEIERNDRQTRRWRNAAPSTAPSNRPERAELVERLMGLRGTLTVYGHELAGIRHKAAALRLKNRALQERVRELQTRPPSRTKPTQR
jgi:hypothetical protein